MLLLPSPSLVCFSGTIGLEVLLSLMNYDLLGHCRCISEENGEIVLAWQSRVYNQASNQG